jgi:hypothetical protein
LWCFGGWWLVGILHAELRADKVGLIDHVRVLISEALLPKKGKDLPSSAVLFLFLFSLFSDDL